MSKQTLLKHHPLSSDEVLKIANANGKVAEFKTYDQIIELPKPGHAYVILLRATENFGHYVALLNHGHTVEWSDSYAYKPDRELKWQTADQNAKLGQDAPKVSHLMREFIDQGGKLEFNEIPFQDEKNPKDEACGFFCGVRILNHRMTLNSYQRWLEATSRSTGLSPSNVVIKIGSEILGQKTGEGYTGGGMFEGGLFELSKNMPKQVKEWLDKYGSHMIKRLTVWRVPLASGLQYILNAATLGKAKKAYDTLFHLYIVMVLDDDSLQLIEKNERVNVMSNDKAKKAIEKKGAESRAVTTPSNLTLNEFIQNAIAKTPNDQLWVYSLLQFNCQRFVLDLLHSNNLLNPELKKFIYQDPSVIASSDGFLASLANSGTNLANRINNWWHGGSDGYVGGVLVAYGGRIYHVQEIPRGGKEPMTHEESRLHTQMRTLERRIRTFETQIQGLQPQFIAAEQTYNQLFDQYDHINGTIDMHESMDNPVPQGLLAQAAQLETRIQAAEQRMHMLRQRIQQLQQNITQIQQQILEIQRRLASVRK